MMLFAAVQTPLVREMREGLERKYRVSVVQEAGDEYAYRLRSRVVVPKTAKGASKIGANVDLHLDVRLTDYRATMSGQKASAALIGGGEMTVDATGLPSGVDVTGPQGPVWLPFVAFYLPRGDEGPFDFAGVKVGTGLELGGKGVLSRADGVAKVELDASFVASGMVLGKLKSSTQLDRAGWPERSSGTLTSENGTFRFTLERA